METPSSSAHHDIEHLRAIIAAQAEELAQKNDALIRKDDELGIKTALVLSQSQQISTMDRALHAKDRVLHANLRLIEELRAQLALLRKARFGKSSERIEKRIEQLELLLGDMEESQSAATSDASQSDIVSGQPSHAIVGKPSRQPLPDHLPREERLYPAACECADFNCPVCGGTDFLCQGESVREELDYIPASFRIIRHIAPRFVCKGCDGTLDGHIPSPVIERGKLGTGLLAHVVVAKYCDHLPLYRQSQIYAREGIALSRSTMADWVGRISNMVRPLIEKLESHVLSGHTLHGDDTPVNVLAPGLGKTQQARLWAMCVTGAALAIKRRLLFSMPIVLIVRGSIRKAICAILPASCMLMAMQASSRFMRPRIPIINRGLLKRPVLPMYGANSMI